MCGHWQEYYGSAFLRYSFICLFIYITSYLSLPIQVTLVDSHIISFMIVRGSVPVFWTQSGNKYRPDPVIQRSKSPIVCLALVHVSATVLTPNIRHNS